MNKKDSLIEVNPIFKRAKRYIKNIQKQGVYPKCVYPKHSKSIEKAFKIHMHPKAFKRHPKTI